MISKVTLINVFVLFVSVIKGNLNVASFIKAFWNEVSYNLITFFSNNDIRFKISILSEIGVRIIYAKT